MIEIKTPHAGEYWLSGSSLIAYVVGFTIDGDPAWQQKNSRQILSDKIGFFLACVHHEPRCDSFDWTEPAAIDPGEGWELLPVGTVLRDGDEVLLEDGSWDATDYVGCKVGDIPSTACTYRRKIKPVESPNDWVEITDRDHKLRHGIDQFNTSIWCRDWSYVYDSCGKTVTQAGFKSARCRRKDLPVLVTCTCPTLDGIPVTGSACPIHGLPSCELTTAAKRVPVRLWRRHCTGVVEATIDPVNDPDPIDLSEEADQILHDENGFYVLEEE